MGYEIHWEPPCGVIKRYFGVVTGGELVASVVKVEADSRFDALRYVINDFLDCSGVDVSPDQIEEVAAIDHAAALINPNIRIAIVATLPEVIAGSHSYANDPLNVFVTRVFASMGEARAWLQSAIT